MRAINHYISCALITIVIIFGHVSCKDNSGQIKKVETVKKIESVSTPIKKNILLVKGDSLQVSIKDSFITVPKKSILNYDSVYTGIYSITKNSINKTFSVKINGIAYFTTYYSVGMGYNRGYLYAFDLKSKRLLTNQSTKENYIFSSAGIFFLKKEHLFSVSAPNHENADDPFNTIVEVYKINKGRFHYVKYIKLNGEMTVDDTSIIKLYNKVVK